MYSNRYNMHGCSSRHRHRHRHRGGMSANNSLSLGYTGVTTKGINNPFLGYTGGAAACNASAPSNAADFLGYTSNGGLKGGMVPRLINADSFSNAPNLLAQNGGDGFPKPMPDATINLSDSGSVFTGSNPYLVTQSKGGMAPDIAKAYPSTVGSPTNVNWINNQTLHGGGGSRTVRSHRRHRGGDCGCSTPSFFGGAKSQRGGRNYGDLVPNGLLGQSWTSNIGTWPGVDGVAMNRGHYDLNTYATDVSRQTQAIGANFPFSGLPWKGGGNRRRRTYRRKQRSRRSSITYKQGCSSRNRKMRGGALSNFLSQDIINLGREFGFNVNSAYNALNGTAAPVNPLPWKGQLQQSST